MPRPSLRWLAVQTVVPGPAVNWSAGLQLTTAISIPDAPRKATACRSLVAVVVSDRRSRCRLSLHPLAGVTSPSRDYWMWEIRLPNESRRITSPTNPVSTRRFEVANGDETCPGRASAPMGSPPSSTAGCLVRGCRSRETCSTGRSAQFGIGQLPDHRHRTADLTALKSPLSGRTTSGRPLGRE